MRLELVVFRRLSLRRLAIWLLVLVLPLQGLAATLAQARGPAHVHVHVHTVNDNSMVLADFRRNLGSSEQVNPIEQAVVDALHGHSHAGTRFHYHALTDASVVYVDGDSFCGSTSHSDSATVNAVGAFFPLPIDGNAFALASSATHSLDPGSLWVPTAAFSTRLERPPQALPA